MSRNKDTGSTGTPPPPDGWTAAEIAHPTYQHYKGSKTTFSFAVFSIDSTTHQTPMLNKVSRMESINGTVVVTLAEGVEIELEKNESIEFSSPLSARVTLTSKGFAQLHVSSRRRKLAKPLSPGPSQPIIRPR